MCLGKDHVGIWGRVNVNTGKGATKSKSWHCLIQGDSKEVFPSSEMRNLVCTGVTQLQGQMYHSPKMNWTTKTPFYGSTF